jgi:hypothetical protein
MKAEYRITEDDYAKAARLHMWWYLIAQRSAIVTYAVIVILLGLAAWMFPAFAPFAAVIVVFVMSTVLLAVYFSAPNRARRYYRQYKAIHEPMTVELSDDGLRFRSTDGEGIVRWRTIFKWRQNRRFVLIYPMPILYYIVPKSLEQQGFDIPLLVQRLTERVGKER